MASDVLLLHGMECAKCTRPARSHSFKTGQTVHLSPYATHCQVSPPRPIPTPVGGD